MKAPSYRLLFLGLLVVNVAAMSAVIGAVASGARFERPQPPAQQSAAPRQCAPAVASPAPERGGGFMAALPQARRDVIRAEIVAAMRASRPQREQARAARRALAQAVAQEPYDPVAVNQSLARLRAADEAVLVAMHTALAAAMAEMNPEERRAAVAAAMRAGGERLGPGMDGGARPDRALRTPLPEGQAGEGPLRERVRERLQESRAAPANDQPPPPAVSPP